MSLEPSDFYIARSVGEGRSHRGDVRRTRRALARIDYGGSLNSRATSVTPGLISAIEAFQTEFGLKPDGVIRPGGPTERALSMAVRARNRKGPRGTALLRTEFSRRADAGLVFRPDPRKRNAGVWLDDAGNALTDRQADETAARVRVAQLVLPSPPPPPLSAGNTSSPPNIRLPENPWSLLDPRRAGETLLNRAREILAWHELLLFSMTPQGQEKLKEGELPPLTKLLHLHKPPPPLKPPHEMHEPEKILKEKRRPTLMVSPIPELGKPAIEIFPDMSNDFERWLVVENSRGTKEGQQKDVQYLIDGLYRRLEARGLLNCYTHNFGGKTFAEREKDQKYMKERWIERYPKAGHKGSARPDISYLIDGSQEDINVVDTLKDNKTMTAREKRNFDKLIRNKEANDQFGKTRQIGKSKGMTWEEFTAIADRFLDDLVDELAERLKDRPCAQPGYVKP